MKNSRFYKNYLMKNKYAEYRNILSTALEKGYKFILLRDFDLDNEDEKTIILRHDVDNNLRITKKMYKIEKSLGIKSTYYFRLNTLDMKFIKQLIEDGNEVGYHFEEIATYIHKTGVVNKEEVFANIDSIRELFLTNFFNFERKIERKIETLASHGDFLNRKLAITNNALINDEVREKTKIKAEAYDKAVNDNRVYCSDCNQDFLEVLSFNDKKYYMLIHARNWNSAFFRNMYLDLNRVIKGIRYRIKSRKT